MRFQAFEFLNKTIFYLVLLCLAASLFDIQYVEYIKGVRGEKQFVLLPIKQLISLLEKAIYFHTFEANLVMRIKK